jgi:hypothetical protein
VLIDTPAENIELLTSFIQKNLNKDIRTLERRRKNFYMHSRLIYAFATSVLLHVPVFFIPHLVARSIAHQLLLLLNLGLSYLAFFRYRNDDRLFNDYRRKIIPVLLAQISPKYKYAPAGKILAKEFVASGLYYGPLHSLVRKDLILGLFEKAAFSLSYVKAQKQEFIGKSGITGTANSTMITRFQGLHYVFKVPITFTGKTMIMPIKSTMLKEVDDINTYNLNTRAANVHSKRIQTGNPAFDERFAVFTSFEKEARAFLSEKRMKSIIEVEGLFRNTIALSFYNSFVFMQAHTNQEIFKLDLSKPITTSQVAENYLNLRIALKAVRILLS